MQICHEPHGNPFVSHRKPKGNLWGSHRGNAWNPTGKPWEFNMRSKGIPWESQMAFMGHHFRESTGEPKKNLELHIMYIIYISIERNQRDAGHPRQYACPSQET